MDDLLAFLRQALDDDERVAQAVQHSRPGPWAVRPDSAGVREIYSVSRDEEHGGDSNVMPDAWHDEAARHIARWDPARVLAEVEAKRRILSSYTLFATDDPPVGTYASGLRDAITLLAQPYADRPGFPEEWRVP